jgi:hypothetical protein
MVGEVFIANFLLYFLAGAPPKKKTAAVTRTRSVSIWAAAARGGASFRSTDAAQVCSNVGFCPVDGVFECSAAIAARLSERW